MINVAIVGTGSIAYIHTESLLTFPERCRITALCNTNTSKAEKLKEEFSLDAEIFGDYRQMLASDVKIDTVIICTPPFTHAEIAIAAMDSGRNVLVEKPMATCLEECDEMLEAEKRNGVVLGCVAQNRFKNSIYKLKTLLDSGEVGKPRIAHVNSLWNRGDSYYDLWWRGLWQKEGGGCTLNHAVHHIDMINWIQGGLPERVFSVISNLRHENAQVEDISLSTLKYADGSIAQLTASVVHHGEEQGLVLQCDKAKIAAPWSCYASSYRENGFPLRNTAMEEHINKKYENIPDLKYEGHTGEIDNYLDALEKGTRPLITGVDGRRTIELVTAIYKSGMTEQPVTLPIAKEDDFYTFEGLLAHVPHFHEKTKSLEGFSDNTITVGSSEENK